MDIRQLQYFVAVYELGGISAASARLHVAQPAVTRTLHSLAADLNVELFQRQGRGIRPTAAADRLYVHACQLLQDIETTRLHVQSTQDSPIGHLTFACTDQVGRIFTPHVIGKFHREFPRVKVAVWEGMAATVYDWLLAGVVDVALLTSPPPSPMIRTWGKWVRPMLVAASSRWQEAPYADLLGGEVTLSNLARLPLILPRPGNSHRMLIDGALARIRKSPTLAFEVDGVSTINAMVGAGLGCTVLMRKALETEIERGAICAFPISDPGILAEVTILSPRDRLQTQAATALIDILTDPDLGDRVFGD